MPRQSRGAPARPSAPSRPMAPARPAAAPQQTRSASTAAHPPATQQQQGMQQAPVQQSQGPGLFGQMASTAAGVAVGSSIGHAIGGFFGGGSSAAPVEQQAQAVQSSAYEAPKVCEQDVFNFRKCMDQNQGDLNICGWYLDQLKACQQAASQY